MFRFWWWTELCLPLAPVHNHTHFTNCVTLNKLPNFFRLALLDYKWINCCCSIAQSCPTLCNSIECSTQGCPVPHHYQDLAQTQVHWISDPTQPSHPCWPLLLPSVIPRSTSFLMSRLFSSGGWRIGASVSRFSPSNEYSGLVSFRINWFDLLAVQRTLKHIIQHHSWKASILWCSAFL